MYSYNSPGEKEAKLDYGFKDFEIFGYNPGAAFAPPPKPKGPIDLGVYSDGENPPHYYKINQTSSRSSKLLVYSDSNATTLVETRKLPEKLYGQKTLDVATPAGKVVELTLHGNFDTDIKYTKGSSNEDLKNQAKSEASGAGVNINENDIDVNAARSQNSVSDQPITYSSNALITPGVSGGASGGISNSQLMVPHMRNLLLL